MPPVKARIAAGASLILKGIHAFKITLLIVVVNLRVVICMLNLHSYLHIGKWGHRVHDRYLQGIQGGKSG